MRRIVTTALAVMTLLVVISPGIAYLYSLSRINRMPVASQLCTIPEVEKSALWVQMREEGPLVVEPLNPWNVAMEFVFADSERRSPGQRVAWYVARAHNAQYLSDPNLQWHFAGAALTIWLTRNWSAEELLCRVSEIQKSRVET